VSAAVLVSGSSLNYDAMYHQLHIAQQLRAQLEDGLEAADLSSIANTSVDTAVRQLVSSRIMQVARDVKESVENERTRTRASALLSSPTAAPAKTHRGGAAKAAAASSSSTHAPSAPHARRMRMRGTQLTCFTSTTVQILTRTKRVCRRDGGGHARAGSLDNSAHSGTQQAKDRVAEARRENREECRGRVHSTGAGMLVGLLY
jgi:hypothetical protein